MRPGWRPPALGGTALGGTALGGTALGGTALVIARSGGRGCAGLLQIGLAWRPSKE